MKPFASSDLLICRMAQNSGDVSACQALRFACFHGGVGVDKDMYDAVSSHVMVERDGILVCTLRLRILPDGSDFAQTYTGRFYDFGPLKGPTLEIGRFCVAEDAFSLAILQQAWAAITAWVDLHNVTYLFGCASFSGSDPAAYADAFGKLLADHQGSIPISPKVSDTKSLSMVQADPFDAKRAMQQMPKLLRSYLAMGGFVSDHLVVDRLLGTLHVFIGLEIAAIPAARVKSLRKMVAQAQV